MERNQDSRLSMWLRVTGVILAALGGIPAVYLAAKGVQLAGDIPLETHDSHGEPLVMISIFFGGAFAMMVYGVALALFPRLMNSWLNLDPRSKGRASLGGATFVGAMVGSMVASGYVYYWLVHPLLRASGLGPH